MKLNLQKGLFFTLATSFLFFGSCSKESTDPKEDPTTPTNELLGFWHGGADYFGEDLNLEFKESSLTMSNYDNTQSNDYNCEYGDNKVTITDASTSNVNVITYAMSGTSSVTFTDEDGDSFTMQSGKGSNGSGGGGGGDPHYKVTIDDFILTACDKTGELEYFILVDHKDGSTVKKSWESEHEDLEFPDDIPWTFMGFINKPEDPFMSYSDIQNGDEFKIRLYYVSTQGNGNLSLGAVYLVSLVQYGSRPTKYTVSDSNFTLELSLSWDEE